VIGGRRRRLRRWGRSDGSDRAGLLRFGGRLALSLTLALVVGGGFAYWLVSRDLEHNQFQADAALHRADARLLVAAAAGKLSPGVWIPEVSDRLRLLEQRPGTLEAILVDRQFRIVAASDPRLIGSVEKTPHVAAVLRSGSSWVGHEAGLRHVVSDTEFLQPLALPGGRYVFELTDDAEYLSRQLRSVSNGFSLAGIVALLGATGLFWFTGGRALLRAHSIALHRATRDGLTDLANHRAFQSELDRTATLATRSGEPLALMTLDLDGFKFVNDRYGHGRGDERLKAVAKAMVAGRAGDQPFRVGGDEFAVILPHTDSVGACRLAERLRQELAHQQVPISVGVTELHAGHTPADLREEADAALYEAKRQGGGRVVAFADVAADLSLITSARAAGLQALLADGDMEIAFQPIWNLRSRSLLGVEALARPDARHGFSGPADAFDAAQQLGRLHDLDVLCVTRILQRAPDLPPDALLFINISPQTLDLDASGSPWVEQAVRAAELDPARVVIEVTERVGGRTNLVIQSLRRLHDQGFRIAIDDLGTGNSGLQMLRDTHAEYIKLDRSIVTGALTSTNARAILVAITAYAHHTGAFVIAEGVEDSATLDLVVDLGSDASVARISGGQGYGLGHPNRDIPADITTTPPELLEHSIVVAR